MARCCVSSQAEEYDAQAVTKFTSQAPSTVINRSVSSTGFVHA
jgi:hypothetical protein